MPPGITIVETYRFRHHVRVSIAFLVTTLVIVATPGTGALYTIAAGLSRGARAGVVAAAGCTLGILPHLLATVTGLAAVMHASAVAFHTIKYAGVAYLLYLAWQTWRDRSELTVDEASGPRSDLEVIRTAVAINVLNPKLTIFFFAFLPQFVSGSADPLPRMLLLSLVFMLVTFVVFALYGWVAAGFRRRVLERPRVLQWLRRIFAGSTSPWPDAWRSRAADPDIRTRTVRSPVYGRLMDMLSGDQIQDAHLTDWRKLAQGLHARYVVADFRSGARFLAAVADAVDDHGDHLRATVGDGFIDLKLITLDAVYRDGDGNEHEVEWVTEQDLDLARRISEVAAEHAARPDPAGITNIELALDTAHEERLATFWSALLTGGQAARGRGTIGNDVRDGEGGCPTCGSRRPRSTRRRDSASTSTCSCRASTRSSASPPPWTREAWWSARRTASPSSPTLTATRPV